MSVLIKGMEKPTSCRACMYSRTDIHNVDWCVLTEKDLPCECPITDAPDDGERKHGEWMKAVQGLDESWVCSECMEEYVSVDADFIDYAHYCPNCGARMDLVQVDQ